MKLLTFATAVSFITTTNSFTIQPKRALSTSSTKLQFEFSDLLPNFGGAADEEPDLVPESFEENGIQIGDAFPKAALKKMGVSGKKSVVYFYGADDAPSCKKQNVAFDESMDVFTKLGATVIGVRNEKGVKGDTGVVQTLFVDEDDEIR